LSVRSDQPGQNVMVLGTQALLPSFDAIAAI
jgi:hypothetical protein